MLKVSKKFELDGHIVILSVTVESAQYYDKFRVVAPETYEAFF